MTNDYYLTDVRADTNNIYCVGEIEEGNLLCTCPVLGVAMRAGHKDVAFGIAKESKSYNKVLPVLVEFFEERK